MAHLVQEVKELANRHIANGEEVQFAFEHVGQAAIEIVPEDHPHRNIILEGLYARLAKILGRDSSVYLKQ